MRIPVWKQHCCEIHKELTKRAEKYGNERSEDGKLLVGRGIVKILIEDMVGADPRTVKKYTDLLRERGYLKGGVNQYQFQLAPLPGTVRLNEFDVPHPERALEVIEEVQTK